MPRGEGGGRPRIKIDVEQLEKCAEKHWTTREIAAFFRVSERSINRRFGTLIQECRQRGKTKLRDLQWKRALEGSDRILLHMSKHYLDQQEKLEVTGRDGAPVSPQINITLPSKDPVED